MNIKAAVLSFVLAFVLVSAASAQSVSTATYGNVTAVATKIEYSGDGKAVLSGKARIKSVDKATGTTFEADAKNITFGIARAKSGTQAKTGIGGLDTATMDGPVKIVHTEVDAAGNTIRTTATADSATYDGATQMAKLSGKVRIVSENPALFEEPAVMTGDVATVNLKPNLSPLDMRFRVESTSGVSTIEATPKKDLQKTK